MTLSYEDIFSRVIGRYTDPKELSLNEDDLYELYAERLHNVVADPYIKSIFSTLYLDDEIQEMEYSLKRSEGEQIDENYVLGILVQGMTIEWLKPQVESSLFLVPVLASSQEKKILDGHDNMINRLNSLETKLHKTIRDHGMISNSYLDGES